MSEKDALYPIIKKVERKKEPDPAYQIKIVKGDIFHRTYYLVSNNNTGRALAHGHLLVPVKAHEKNWTLNLRLEYTATMASGMGQRTAEKIVIALGGDHPQADLEQCIRDLIGRSISDQGGPAEFISQFNRSKDSLVANIQRSIEEEVGLSLRLAITPIIVGKAFESTRPFAKEIRFHVQDYLDAITAKLSLDLDAQPGVWAYIHHPALDQLMNDIAASAEMFLKKVSLQEITFEVEKVRKKLREELENLANRRGRTVGRLGFECRLPFKDPVQEMRRITLNKIEFPNLIEYPETVIARCELQLELERLGTYVEQKQPDLESWAAKTVHTAILKKLLDVPYIDLFLGQAGTGKNQTGFRFYDWKMEETQKTICEQAETIGYRVSSIFIRMTNLQFDELRRGVRIAIVGEEYETKVPGYPAGLDVEIFARITSEEVIRQLFRQDVDIKKIIRETIREEIRKRLRGMSPEKYYTHFEGSEEIGSASVLDGLSHLIKESMTRNYKAEDITITCTQRLTDLAKLFYDLRRDQREIEVEDERSGLKFIVAFRVDSLIQKYWEEFQFRRPTPEIVQKNVEYAIKQRLSSVGRGRLMQMQDSAIRATLYKFVGLEDVPAELGVSVKITYFARKITDGEQHILSVLQDGLQEPLEDARNARKIKQLNQSTLEASLDELQRQRVLAIKSGEPEEVKKVDEMIRASKTAWVENENGSAFQGIAKVIQGVAQTEISNLSGMFGDSKPGRLLSRSEPEPIQQKAAGPDGELMRGGVEAELFPEEG